MRGKVKMNIYGKARALVHKNSKFSAIAVASVERELIWSSALNQDDSKIANFLATAKALVARNFLGIYFLKKGTVK